MVHKIKENKLALILVVIVSLMITFTIIKSHNITVIELVNYTVTIIAFWLLYILSLRDKELKHVKSEFKKEQGKLHDALEYSSNWIAYKDLDGKITGCNDIVCSFFKLERKDIIGRNMFEYFTPDEADKISTFEKLVIKTKQTIEYNIEIEHNGEIEYFKVTKSPLLDENDEVYGTSTICSNTTDLMFTTKIKELYTESLAHDFKNPIVAQYKALEALKTGAVGELTRDQLEIINQISSSCKFVEQMLNAQLASFKYSMISYSIKPTEICLSKSLNDYINNIQPMIDGKGLKVINCIEPNVNVVSDKSLLLRAIMNIIFNAIAHSAENTEFKVSASATDSTFEFYIENFCIKEQFTQETLKQMFERFALAREKFRQVGAGIGLYIVKEIVRFLDGELYLKVTNENEKYDKFQIKFSMPKNVGYLKDKSFNFK